MRRVSRFCVAAVLVSGSALASPTYPGVLKAETRSSVLPPCTVCHEDNSGGPGTVTQDFGLALQDQGLTSNDTSKLKALLATFCEERVDTDGDGTSDCDELAAGRNPNVPGPNDCFAGSTACGTSPDGGTGNGGVGGGEPLPPVTYGCSAGAGGALVSLALAVAALALRRRRWR